MTARPRHESQDDDRAPQRAQFTALALDHAAARRAAPYSPVRDPEVIERWGRSLRERWQTMDAAERAAVRTAIRDYAYIEIAEGAGEDADGAIRFLDGEQL